MSINIQRDNNLKNLQVKVNNKGIDDIYISNDNNTIYKEKEDDLGGLDFLTNDNKKVNLSEDDSSDAESEDERSDIDPFMEPVSSYEREDPYANLSHEEILHKKGFLLSQLKRLEKKGHLPQRRLGVEHSIEEIESEVVRIKKEIEIDNGVNYCKQGLVFFANTIEMANSKLNIAKLDGFSIHVMSTQDQYDEVFEELYEKYASSINAGPEIKFITMFAASAFMFHLQKVLAEEQVGKGNILNVINKMSNKMKGPSQTTEDIMRNLESDSVSDMSDISSERSYISETMEKPKKTISIPAKRGRPRKNK